MPGDIFGMMITARFEIVGPETITVIDTERHCLRIAENCQSDRMDWTFTNEYWVDASDGTVWRSRQHYVPQHPPITMTVATPYRSA